MRMRCCAGIVSFPFIVVWTGGNGSRSIIRPEGRQVVRKMMPMYPEVAKKMNLIGTVKVHCRCRTGRDGEER